VLEEDDCDGGADQLAREQEADLVLETWGRQVVASAQLKRIRARRLYTPQRLPTLEEFGKGKKWAANYR